ncbi:MAG: aminoacyl-tRNA hydrolase [Clostridia bacterium]|nr:aminoacyl-tRNA hydrolase [Clostridia bacterium]
MKCIIGLGNIGKEYENTRHNSGFIALDAIAEKYNISFDKKKKKCVYGEGIINGKKVSLIKPTTYMNLSGEAIVEMMNWYKITPEDILVIYDDVDLKLGTIRYREKGSSGTHNGMKNIIANLKTEEFARIRIGIENRGDTPIPLMDYVLQRFSKEELNTIKEQIVPQVEENILNFLTK